MFELDGGRLFQALSFVSATTQLLLDFDRREKILTPARPWPSLSERGIEDLRSRLRDIADIGERAELPATVRSAGVALDELALLPPANDLGVAVEGEAFHRLLGALERIQTVSQSESESRTFLALGAAGNRLWNAATPLFGAAVYEAYPSAREDIEEAGKCLAVDRGTACVMHLMRATEVPLKALASNLGIRRQNDWGSYIREVEKELAVRFKASGKRTPDETFYAEIAESFERVKRGWRNRSMHLDQNYSPERAMGIFDATGEFMRHLAGRFRE